MTTGTELLVILTEILHLFHKLRMTKFLTYLGEILYMNLLLLSKAPRRALGVMWNLLPYHKTSRRFIAIARIQWRGGGLYPQSFVEYYIFNESAWNTCNKDVAAQSEGILQKIVKVPIYRLCDVFDIYMPKDVEIDFLSVDCEGFDLSVLSSNDWQRYRPKFVVVEILSNVYGELDMFALEKNEIAQFLFSKDYALVAKAHNSVIFKDIALL